MDYVSWQELQGNRFVRRLEAEMLERDVTYTSNARLQGERKTSSEQLKSVVYDRSYVLNWIVKLLIIPLGIQAKKELDKLMTEAWALHEERRETE